MRKLFTILFIGLLIFNLSAQTVGLKAGFNLGNITWGSDAKDALVAMNATSNMMIGISVGATGSFELSDILTLNTELNFTQKGTKLSIDGFDDDLSTKINFIDIIPAISYKITDVLSASMGPYVGFALSGTQDVAEIDLITGETSIKSEAIDFEESEINTLDYGLNIGVSYVLNEIFVINTGYSIGFADLNGGDQGGLDLSEKTNGIYFSIGYLFDN